MKQRGSLPEWWKRLQQLGVLFGIVSLTVSGARAQPPAPSGEATGKVVTQAEKPVPEATVFWIERDEEGETHRRFVAHTDAKGEFRFAEAIPKPGEARYVTFLVETQEGALSFLNVNPNPKATKPLTILVKPSTALRVSFLDKNNRPASNTLIRVSMLMQGQRGFLFIPADMKGRWVQKTDAKGECVFPGLPQEARVRFQVDDEAFASLSYEDDITLGKSANQQGTPLHLQPGVSVVGKVTQADNSSPIAGVKVGAQGVGNHIGWGQAVTDANGNYRITQLLPGTYNIALFLKGDREKNSTARALEQVEVKPGKALDKQDFLLIKGSLLTGTVTDKATGKPLSGVMIGIMGPAHPRSGAAVQVAKTGANGVYQARVPAGQNHVYVMGVPSEQYERPQKGVDFTVGEDAIHTQDFTLAPSAVVNIKPIQVQVVGPDGKPVAKASVFVTPVSKEPYFSAPAEAVEADKEGKATLEMRTATARIRARFGNLATEKTLLAQSGDSLTISLKPNMLLSLSGRILDEAGKPLANAKAMLIEWELDMGLGGVSVNTDAQGRYTFPDLWPDPRYSVSAEAPGYGTDGTNHEEFKPGEKTQLPDIKLPRADSFVAGRVVDEKGDAVAKLPLLLQGRKNKPIEIFTDDKGKFRFDNVVKEAVTIYIRESNGFPDPKRANAGDADVIIVRKAPVSKADAERDTQQEESRKTQEALLGKAAPALKIASWLNTKGNMPADLTGKIVLIDFWATSCGPCVASLPAVQKVSEQFAGRGVVVIGLHAGGGNKALIRDLMKAHKLTYPIAIDTEDPDMKTFGVTMKGYGVLGIPQVAVLDRKGKVVYLNFGLDGAVGSIGNLLSQEK